MIRLLSICCYFITKYRCTFEYLPSGISLITIRGYAILLQPALFPQNSKHLSGSSVRYMLIKRQSEAAIFFLNLLLRIDLLNISFSQIKKKDNMEEKFEGTKGEIKSHKAK